MLNLAIIVLVALVIATLWLLLRPAATLADAGAIEKTMPDADGDAPAAPLGHPEVRVSTLPQSDEHPASH